MLVTGKRFCHVWALMGGSRIETYLLEADPDYQTLIWESVFDFLYDHVHPKVPPPEALDDEWALTVTGLAGTVIADGDLLTYGDKLNRATLTEKGDTYPTVVVEHAGTVVAWASV